MKKIIATLGLSLMLVSCGDEQIPPPPVTNTVTLYANDGAVIKVYYKADVRYIGDHVNFVDSSGKFVRISGIYTVE